MPQASESNSVEITPTDMVERHSTEWRGLRTEVVTAVERRPFEFSYQADQHLLIASELSERDDGETSLEGLPTSTLHDLSGRLTFVPAGHRVSGWHDPRVLTRVTYFYLDPASPLYEGCVLASAGAVRPRLYFTDPDLWQLTRRLKEAALDGGGLRLPQYGEALGVLLGYELTRINGGARSRNGVISGGLSGAQQKKIVAFIEEHLAEPVPLSALAAIANLSPYHFTRAFKRSFGVPPHRYHVQRRIERAKVMLREGRSVTDVALAVGFVETSSFSTAFRKMTGVTPRDFRLSL